MSGRAVMGVWVVDFTEASLDAHHELQFSILVSHQPVPPIEDHPLALLKALFANPQARMFCYGLWNNTKTVVAYNREVLGLNARLSKGHIERKDGQKRFRLTNEMGELLFAGQVREDKQTSPRVGWALFRLLGLRHTWQAFSQPYLGAKVVNPVSDRFPFNGDAESFLAADAPIVQFFDATTDIIDFGGAVANDFGFEPHFVEHFSPFRFVYLEPKRV
jgi:hypothetical protein